MIDRPLEFRTVRGGARAESGSSMPLLRLTADLRVRPGQAPIGHTPATEPLLLQAKAATATPATTAQPSSPPPAEVSQGATPAGPEAAPRTTTKAAPAPAPDQDESSPEGSAPAAKADPAQMKAFRDDNAASLSAVTIEGKTGGPVMPGPARPGAGEGGGGHGGAKFHKRMGPEDFQQSLKLGLRTVWRNLSMVMLMTCATNVLILAIPIYLFQISDRVLTSRSTDTLIMLTLVIVGAVVLQAMFDAVRRFMLMRTAVEVAARLGAPVLSAAAAASLHGSGREYQTLGDLQQLRGFLVSGTLLSFLDVPFAPLFILVIFMIHPHLGMIVVVTALLLLVVALINQRITAKPFAEANLAQAKANMHLDSMSRNSQIINAMAMIPEAVTIWGRDTAASLIAQVRAQDRNIISASVSRAVRMLTQVGMLGWGAYLAIDGQITGGMVIAASIVAGRALAPIEGSIEGWNAFILSRAAYGRVASLLRGSRLQFERLWLPRPEGRLNVERLLYVPGGTKQVILNGISFALEPGDSLAVIGNSGAGKTTLGKMLVGSILPTSGNVRLDLMDLRNWDPRQLGENIGYLPQDVQLFPGTIKENIGRMRADATDEQIHHAAVLADVHEMIASLPQGYETMVAADGAPLSGGQKQRIALARAFFGNPRLVVLDEPNSNLDTAGDKALARAIDHARKEKITVVVITQKPSLLNVVDKIMLLANGGVALFGQRDKVMAQLNPAAARPPQVPEGGANALAKPQQPGTPRHV
ncbi:MAG: type I secretion system permease/ATPase [Rhodobacterales bacterium]|nr:type I secretion system permease/ATPase [Rhodobacterales bacterium]MDX5390939.1 type I secretion system permease/ATPase [Rhodobacterales bacterium]MDX5490634.1 type I secretion system permease/ATPase [Rhodobacterales bacterium]